MDELRFLPTRDLEMIACQMICREYKAGEILWRTGARLDFLGIIQSGEIILEHRFRGSIIRSVKLSAGDCIQPNNPTKKKQSTVLARAVTDARLYVLNIEQLNAIRLKPSDSRNTLGAWWHRLWTLAIVFLIMIAIWNDLTRILSGAIYLTSNPQSTITDYQSSLDLLRYAELIDQTAAFAFNQEGYIWFQNKNLDFADTAFAEAYILDQTNGNILNNLAVSHSMDGQFESAATFLADAVTYDPNNSIVRYNLGLVLLEQNNHSGALREFKEAGYINSSWALPYIQQGIIYLQWQDFTNAERVSRSAIQIDPLQESAHLILAISLYNQGENQNALKSVENALQINPNGNVAKFYKALIMKNLGETDAALSILRQILDSTNDPQQAFRVSTEIEAIHRSLQSSSDGIR